MNQSPEQIHQLIEDLSAQISRLRQMVDTQYPVDEQQRHREEARDFGSSATSSSYGTVIEGVFDGQNMVGPDGKVYTVPANYASKSKLVEGDLMKLTIKKDGTFLYKQIGPIERMRQLGHLVKDEEFGVWRAMTTSGRSYRLLTASVTYFKGQAGDVVTILVPKDGDSRWGAVENIVADEGEHLDDIYVDQSDLAFEDDEDILLRESDELLDAGEGLLEEGNDGLLEDGEDFFLEDGNDTLLGEGDDMLLEDGQDGLLDDADDFFLEDGEEKTEQDEEISLFDDFAESTTQVQTNTAPPLPPPLPPLPPRP